MTKLLIVESPAKAKTIANYLGPGWLVRASYGHIRDLPSNEMGVDPDRGFHCTYVALENKAKVISALEDAAAKASEIFLATDFDREGEAIAWHVAELLGIPAGKRQRITFTEITKSAITAAIAAPRGLDEDLIDAQQARRVIDRLVGYTLSPLVSDWLRGRLSAGRVQSAGLKVIVDREREILSFVPVSYHIIKALVDPEGVDGRFWAGLTSVNGTEVKNTDIRDKDTAKTITDNLKAGRGEITSVESDVATRGPAAPFTTSSLQQEASRKLGFSPKKTMDIAQVLYQGVEVGGTSVGLITYMRTDSTNLAEEALEAVNRYVADNYDQPYRLDNPRTFAARTKGAQEAHEAIRPTDVDRTPDAVKDDLDADQLALYELIWKRTVATQMAAATYDTMAIGVEVKGGGATYGLTAKGRRLTFDGFLAVYEEDEDETNNDNDPEESAELFPAVTAGMAAAVADVNSKAAKTKPPVRFTEAAFIKELEKLGIGRPSTFAATVTTLKDRGYVVVERKKLKPTELGTVLVETLEAHFPEIVDSGFTAEMEADLDKVAEGERGWKPLLGEFWDPFSAKVAERKNSVDPSEVLGEVDHACPRCQSKLVVRFGKKGRFIACTSYPECRYAMNADTNRTSETCPACEKGNLLERSKDGRSYLSCEMYPECRYARGSDDEITDRTCPTCEKGRVLSRKSQSGGVYFVCEMRPACPWSEDPTAINTGERCPGCGEGTLLMKEGKYGEYLSCTRRSEGCPYLRPASDRVLEEACPDCGARLVERVGKHGTYVCCEMRPRCEFIRRDEGRETDEICPECKEGCLMEKDGRYGPYLSCSRRREGCEYLRPSDAKVLNETCPECEARLVERPGKHGPFICCERRPRCSYIQRKEGSAAQPTGVTCPKCNKGELMGRTGTKGAFWGCSTYPKCRFTSEHRPMAVKCGNCGGMVVQTPTQAQCADCHRPS